MELSQWEEDEDLVLDAITGLDTTDSGWVYAKCPFCLLNGRFKSKKTLSFNPVNGYYKCWHGQCLVEGFVKRYNFVAPPAATKELPSLDLPKEYVPIGPSHPGWDDVMLKFYTAYLARRGVTAECVDEARLGACTTGKYAGCVVVPVTRAGEVKGFVARSIVGKRFLNVPGFKREWMLNSDALWVDTDVPLALVEGPFDALPHWPHAVAFLGKPTKDQIKTLVTATRPLVPLLDADASSESEALGLTLMMSKKEVKFVRMPPGMDPGELSHDQFLELTGIGRFIA